MSARKVVMKIVSISFSILILILLVFVLYRGGQMAYKFGYRVFTEKRLTCRMREKTKSLPFLLAWGRRNWGSC